MIYVKIDAHFVTPPPSFTLCLKRHLGQYWFIYLKCYSEWQLGAIKIELTTLTLRITEDSAKQLVNSLDVHSHFQHSLQGQIVYSMP